MPKPPLNVRVSTLESELEFTIQEKATGDILFDQVIKATGIRETWYFGLAFTDSHNQQSWLVKSKKIVKQDLKKEAVKKLQFKFKYFPENVADEVIQDSTLRLLFKQVRKDILDEAIYCPAEKAVLLASFAVQAKFSDYDEDVHTTGYLANEKLLPQSIINQHTLSIEDWEEKVTSFHKHYRGMSREEAMLDYLKIAQDLEMFGITYFPIMNKRGTEMLLGVDPLGINVYDKSDKLTPKIAFPWSEIKKISHDKDKFKVRLTDKTSQPFEGRTKEPNGAGKIYDLCAGNHEMFVRRRKPDTLEVQQMKTLKAEEKKARQIEREALKREIAAREKEEARRLEMEARFKALQEEMEKRSNELSDARSTIEKLQRQLEETQSSRQELEKQQSELKEMLEKLEADRNMELSERLKLEEEIAAKQMEISEVKSTVESKEAEAKRLQEEIEAARRQLEETTESMQRAAERAAQEAAAAAAALREEAALQQNGRSSSSSSSSSECGEDVPKIVVDDVDEYRETDAKTEQLLKELRQDLESKRDAEQETDVDRQYRENLSRGRDKFKTLREIRRGNTKRRIDSFENM